ncbi:MAG: hypothetical protein AB7O96_10345 [Pseudobdellovibrionaceae bacterium]
MKIMNVTAAIFALVLAFVTVSAQADRGRDRRPDHGRPGYGRPDHGRPDHGRPDHGRPDHGRPGYGRPDHGRPGYGRPDHGRPDHGRPGYGRPDHGRPGHGGPGYGYMSYEYNGQVAGPANGSPYGVNHCGTEYPQRCFRRGEVCYVNNGYYWDGLRGVNWFHSYQCR